jgi:hypothetical protein
MACGCKKKKNSKEKGYKEKSCDQEKEKNKTAPLKK